MCQLSKWQADVDCLGIEYAFEFTGCLSSAFCISCLSNCLGSKMDTNTLKFPQKASDVIGISFYRLYYVISFSMKLLLHSSREEKGKINSFIYLWEKKECFISNLKPFLYLYLGQDLNWVGMETGGSWAHAPDAVVDRVVPYLKRRFDSFFCTKNK